MTTTTTDSSPPFEDEPATQVPEASTTPAGQPSTVPLRTAVALLARRVHFMAGLIVAPFLAVMCLTGLAYAFTPQINDLLYSREFFVENATGPTRPLAEQVGAALAAHPEGKVSSVLTAPEPDRTTRVVLSVPGLQPGDAFSAEMLTVYVDPYTTKVTGELVTISNEPPSQSWLRDLHSSLHLGDVGSFYSEFVASWLPVIILFGLVLWLTQRRRKNRLRQTVFPSVGKAAGPVRLRNLHGALGLWLTVGLLAISVTGLTWSTYAGARVDQAIEALDAKSPSLTAPKVVPPAGAERITVDRAVEVARAEGLEGELTITPPAAPDKAFKISETAKGLPIQKDSIAIDPYSGATTGHIGWDDYPFLSKLTTLGIQAHSGTLLGLVNQIALALLAIGALVLLALGYRMWWKRRPTGGSLAPPPVWRRMPQPVVFTLVLVAVGIGWAMPVFGVTLVAFIVLDSMINANKRRRAGA
jgi:uncharacterized iron-regulated membrane protein